jgi:hypothetical protein
MRWGLTRFLGVQTDFREVKMQERLADAAHGRVGQRRGPLTLFDLKPFADRGWIQGQR